MIARIILIACVIAVVCARPQQTPEIVKFVNENIGIDGYNFAFETSNGISREEKAVVNNLGTDNEILSVTGSYTYTDNDGKTHQVTFTADENGFRPTVIS